MSEQQREREAPAPVDEGAAKPRPHQRLPSLITQAFEERDPAEQRRLTTELIDTLIAMRAPGDEQEEARLLIAHLDAKTLSRLTDATGRHAHTEAVATLLELGFPHALNVSPEDLQRFRDDEGSLGAEALAVRPHYAQASIIAFTAQAIGLVWCLAVATQALPWAIFSTVLGVAAGLWLRALRPTDTDGLPIALLGVSGAVAGGAGFSSAPMFGLMFAMFVALFVARNDSSGSD